MKHIDQTISTFQINTAQHLLSKHKETNYIFCK